MIPVEDDDELASIQQEIDFLAACDHPNVVRYLVLPRGCLCIPAHVLILCKSTCADKTMPVAVSCSGCNCGDCVLSRIGPCAELNTRRFTLRLCRKSLCIEPGGQVPTQRVCVSYHTSCSCVHLTGQLLCRFLNPSETVM